uniref:Adenosine 3'-phospho 5'-phosphosulfate transporter 2 n=1 Tax=Ciona savignyi TaxID=51511 RepID=H2YAE4_CIOSA
MKKYGLFVTLVQFGFYTIFGFIEKISTEMEERRVPLKTYAGIAMLTIGTIAFSNTSLGYLNYPTQIMFKSSKLIPVMIGGILIQGKKFSIIDFVSCLLMTIGLITFTLTDQKVSPNFDPTGIVLISLALCSDAAIGNIQEVTFKKHKSSNAELVLYSFGIGFLILLLVNSMVGDVFKAVIVL